MGRPGMACRRSTAGAALAALIVLLLTAGSAAAAPFVEVADVRIVEPRDGRATVTAKVTWNAAGVRTFGMSVGDLRLVAVSDRRHRPTLLAHATNPRLAEGVEQAVRLRVRGARRAAAMSAGHRIVLTASQHAPKPGGRLRTDRTYVTVGEARPYGSPQPRVGTEDCSDRAITTGAQLEHCDLVGADLDWALVSVHDPRAFECQRTSRATCLRRADLTGATMVGAHLGGVNLGGARLNGAVATGALLDNVSLAGAEAVGLRAVGATSDARGRDTAANLFAANLTGADLRETEFNGVSVAQARLDRARLQRASWVAPNAQATSFRGANLAGMRLAEAPPVFGFADFTDARLYDPVDGRAQIDVATLLPWATLCRTVTGPSERVDRDCPTEVERDRIAIRDPGREQPYVAVDDATIDPAGTVPRELSATVRWSASGGMTAGDIRVLAVDRRTGVPTQVDAVRIPQGLPEQTRYSVRIGPDRPELLEAMARGNRVVLTATQHPPIQGRATRTAASYVTVSVLQRGPGRGRVGSHDCSRVALTRAPTVDLDFCDLAGAALSNSSFGCTRLQLADLTGVELADGTLTTAQLNGAALAGLRADGASWSNVFALTAHAPRLSLAGGTVTGSLLRARVLDDARFAGTDFVDSTTTFAGASLRRADFTDATLFKGDLSFASLRGARFTRVASTGVTAGGSTLFLSDLTDADLGDSAWTVDEVGEPPWTWSTLCRTRMPRDAAASGDRDCPR